VHRTIRVGIDEYAGGFPFLRGGLMANEPAGAAEFQRFGRARRRHGIHRHIRCIGSHGLAPLSATRRRGSKKIPAASGVIDIGQLTPAPPDDLFSHQSRNVHRPDPLVRRMPQSVHELSGYPRMSEDIIVLGGLASVFCWTYIVLPLIYHYGLAV
jgi:hypothetical protein